MFTYTNVRTGEKHDIEININDVFLHRLNGKSLEHSIGHYRPWMRKDRKNCVATDLGISYFRLLKLMKSPEFINAACDFIETQGEDVNEDLLRKLGAAPYYKNKE